MPFKDPTLALAAMNLRAGQSFVLPADVGRGRALSLLPQAGGAPVTFVDQRISELVSKNRDQLARFTPTRPGVVATTTPAPQLPPPNRPPPIQTITNRFLGGGAPLPGTAQDVIRESTDFLGGPFDSGQHRLDQNVADLAIAQRQTMIPNTNFSVGPLVGGLASAGCAQLPAALQGACNAINNQIFPTNPGTRPGESTCPEGTVNQDGQCVETGFRGQVERFLPGGQTGTLNDLAGAAVTGAFGLPARYPAQVGQIMKGAGSACGAQMMPILRCPRGMRLGDDDLCYVKGTRGVVWKHAKPARPLLSSRDGKILRKAKSLEKKLKRVAGEFVPKPRRAAAPRKC